jgi:2-polyprenyl-3-methyl-5-hydroxy-6-metoxy-1,4-benzoquinol methylase
MKKSNTSKIDQPWPQEGLERSEYCPYCDSTERNLAYKDAQDWSFYTAKGKWTYWTCKNCKALYLDPRPTRETIGQAYGVYYTHKASRINRLTGWFASYVRNTCWYLWYGLKLSPRIELPNRMGPMLNFFKLLISDPYPMQYLVGQKPGKLLDIGCGDGRLLKSASALGWEVIGLEIDAQAVLAAQENGFNVIHGTYENLEGLTKEFDCVICSHVLEHVHDPKDLIQTIYHQLKSGGLLLLSLPNSQSHALKYFGINWRGLEAPRHLALPSSENLEKLLKSVGFDIEGVEMSIMETAAESGRIQRKSHKVSIFDRIKGARLRKVFVNQSSNSYDFIKIRCRKRYIT